MRDMQPFSDVVVLAIKAALAPVQERLARSEQENAGLRERIASLEQKAAAPVAVPSPTDLTPVLERVAGVEARISTIGDLRDRVVTLEAKSVPVEPVAPVAPVPSGPSQADIELSLRDKLEPLTKDIGALRERMIAVETRQPVPGPPGQNGSDGRDGKDGADGLGFDDLDVEFDGDRTLLVKFARGSQAKSWPIVLPFMRQQGVFVEGKSYVPGDVVTWAGSQWHCNVETSAKPGEGSKDWTLIVKRGRDGKDGRDAMQVPVVSVGPNK